MRSTYVYHPIKASWHDKKNKEDKSETKEKDEKTDEGKRFSKTNDKQSAFRQNVLVFKDFETRGFCNFFNSKTLTCYLEGRVLVTSKPRNLEFLNNFGVCSIYRSTDVKISQKITYELIQNRDQKLKHGINMVYKDQSVLSGLLMCVKTHKASRV